MYQLPTQGTTFPTLTSTPVAKYANLYGCTAVWPVTSADITKLGITRRKAQLAHTGAFLHCLHIFTHAHNNIEDLDGGKNMWLGITYKP